MEKGANEQTGTGGAVEMHYRVHAQLSNQA